MASAIALASAGATGLYGASLIDFAPRGPESVDGVGEQHLGDRDVGQLRHPVVPQGAGHDLAVAQPPSPRQRRAERLGHAALDLPAQLLGVDHDPGVGGLHRLQDPHLPGRRVRRATRNPCTLNATERGVPSCVASADPPTS